MSDDVESWSRGNLELLKVCPVCGSDSVVSVYVRRDDFSLMPDMWRFSRCGKCDSLYLNPRPDTTSLPEAYRDYYTHGNGEENTGTDLKQRLINGYLNARFGMSRTPTIKIGALIFRAIFPLAMMLDVYGRHIPRALCGPQTRLLDLGCGNGDYLLRAREMGIRVEGCDPDPKAVAFCRSRGLDVYIGDVFDPRLRENSYDVITLNHVIEHVAAPKAMLVRIYALLKPGGIVWMALPNPQAAGLAIFGRGWKGLHPPYHLMLPPESVLRQWLLDSGFTQVQNLRRGMQSPGLWRESIRVSLRENPPSSAVEWLQRKAKWIADALSLVSPRFSEETMMLARKPLENEA